MTNLVLHTETQCENSSLEDVSHELSRAERRRKRLDSMGLITAGNNESTAKTRIAQIANTRSQDLSWTQIHELAKYSPEFARQKLTEMKRIANDELQSGSRAARAVEALNSSPMERSRFLALLEDLERDWQPKNGIERLLIRQLAQAATGYEKWLTILTAYSELACKKVSEEDEAYEPPRLTEAQAISEATKMMESFQRAIIRIVRALTDLRRKSVIIQGKQVNVGEQQINVS